MNINQKKTSKLILKKLQLSFRKVITISPKLIKFIRLNHKSKNFKTNLELESKNLLPTSRHLHKWKTKQKKWNVKFYLIFSLCSKLLKEFINSWKNDVLEKHENQNHCRIDDFGTYWIRYFNYSKVQPK